MRRDRPRQRNASARRRRKRHPGVRGFAPDSRPRLVRWDEAPEHSIASGASGCSPAGQMVQPCAKSAGHSRFAQCPHRYNSPCRSTRYTARTAGPHRSHISFISRSRLSPSLSRLIHLSLRLEPRCGVSAGLLHFLAGNAANCRPRIVEVGPGASSGRKPGGESCQLRQPHQ
jgi:hypothetical protein